GRLAPRRDRMTATGGPAFTTTMRVVDRVHRDAADGRALAQPAVAAGLAERNVGVIGVGNRPDGCQAFAADDAGLTRAQPELRIALIATDQLGIGASRAGDL